MSLTGLPLLLVSLVAAVAAVAGTVFCWSRGGRLRLLTRAGSILLCEVIAVFAGGVAINRALDLYPSWGTLFQKAPPPPAASRMVNDSTTAMGAWLQLHATEGARNGLAFDWRPAGGDSWDLAAQPTVFVPAAYFSRPAVRFPVVVLAAPKASGTQQAAWDQQKAEDLARTSGPTTPAVLVFLRPNSPSSAGTQIASISDRLSDDFRVSQRGWAAIGVGADALVAPELLRAQPQRYTTAAMVSDGTGEVPQTWLAAAHSVGPDQAALIVTAMPVVQRGAQVPVDLVPTLELRLPDALRWAYPLLPAPLAPPVLGPPGSTISPRQSSPSTAPGSTAPGSTSVGSTSPAPTSPSQKPQRIAAGQARLGGHGG